MCWLPASENHSQCTSHLQLKVVLNAPLGLRPRGKKNTALTSPRGRGQVKEENKNHGHMHDRAGKPAQSTPGAAARKAQNSPSYPMGCAAESDGTTSSAHPTQQHGKLGINKPETCARSFTRSYKVLTPSSKPSKTTKLDSKESPANAQMWLSRDLR